MKHLHLQPRNKIFNPSDSSLKIVSASHGALENNSGIIQCKHTQIFKVAVNDRAPCN